MLENCQGTEVGLLCIYTLITHLLIRLITDCAPQVQVQVQDLFVTYTIIQRVLTSSEM